MTTKYLFRSYNFTFSEWTKLGIYDTVKEAMDALRAFKEKWPVHPVLDIMEITVD